MEWMSQGSQWSIGWYKNYNIWCLCNRNWSVFLKVKLLLLRVGKDGEPDKQSFTINNIWPTSIAAMSVDWSS